MTEMSPIGTHGKMPEWVKSKSFDEQIDKKSLQGRRMFGVDLKINDEDGNRLPHDGVAAGELFVRGNGIISGYYNNEEANQSAFDAEGWFGTGDIASIDAHGFLNIQDRAKDLVKSGGEWISSIVVENIALAHPAVAMAACIGMPHPKWDERPIVVVVKKPDAQASREDILAFFEDKTAKWQIPDDVVFVDAIPLGATDKMQKMALREQLQDYKLPGL
jgi:fatty-acyl-CoA synthase